MFTTMAMMAMAADDEAVTAGELPTEARAERWSDGLTTRAPAEGGFARVIGTTVVLGEASPWFGDVVLGGGVRVGPELTLGATVSGSVMAVDLAEGDHTGLRSLGAEAFLALDYRRWRHALSLGGYGPPGDPSWWYLRDPSEGQGRLVSRYTGDLEGGRTDLHLELRGQLGGVVPAALAVDGAVVHELTPWIAVSLATEVGVIPFGTVMGGVHLRPVDHLELGLTAATPFPLFSGTDLELQPAAEVRAWF